MKRCNFLDRFKSWQLWVAIGSLIVFVVKTIYHSDISTEMSEFLNVLCPILIGFGIINDPYSKKVL